MSHPSGCRQRISAAATTKPRLQEIEVLIISAEGVKNVKHMTKMRTYAHVYVEKEGQVATTHVDDEGETSPTWKEIVKVKFREDLSESNVMEALNVDIYAHGRVRPRTGRFLIRRESSSFSVSEAAEEEEVEETVVSGGGAGKVPAMKCTQE